MAKDSFSITACTGISNAWRGRSYRGSAPRNYLADEFGIARGRLPVAGFGHTRRIAYNSSTEGRRESRRANIYLDYAK